MVICGTLGGCSLPRAIMLYGAGKSQLPVMVGATHEHIEVQPFVSRYPLNSSIDPSWVRVTYETPQNADTVLAWYREQLSARGWRVDTQDDLKRNLHDVPHFAHRERSVNGLKWLEEDIFISCRAQENGSAVSIYLQGDYLGTFAAYRTVAGFIGVSIMSPPGIGPCYWVVIVPMELLF